jgi:hypothetical protein
MQRFLVRNRVTSKFETENNEPGLLALLKTYLKGQCHEKSV